MTTNRFIALLGPYIALLSGTLAAWLSQHFPGMADDVPAATQSITQAITFAVGTFVAWALQHKYLDGAQKWEQAEAARLHALETRVVGDAEAVAAPFGGFDPSIFDDLVAPAPTGLGSGRPSDG